MPRYSRLQIVLHWLVFALITFQFVAHGGIEGAWEVFEETGTKDPGILAFAHIGAGIGVLVFAVLRLILRRTSGVPPLPAGGPDWVERASHWTHVSLYALMILTPLSGMAAWGGGIRPAAEAHEVLKSLLLALVALHVVAALWHQFVLRDGLLTRMRLRG